MMKKKNGKKGFLNWLSLGLLLLLVATGCSKKNRSIDSRFRGNDIYGKDIHGNDIRGDEIQAPEGLQEWNCQDSLKLISYIEKVHLAQPRVTAEKSFLIREALQKILDKRKVPTPFFPPPLPTQASYLRFLPIEEEKVEIWLDRIEDEEAYCQTVEEVAGELEEKSFPVVKKEELLRLLHKGILRYFVASLDPHSTLSESLEVRVGRNSAFFEPDFDENIFAAPPRIEDNHFFKNVEKMSSTMDVQFLGDKKEILYAELFQFDEHTVDYFKEFYQMFVDQAAKRTAMIIDLRSNTGGDARAIEGLADLFLKEGPTLVMREKCKKGEDHLHDHLHEAKSGNELVEIESLPIIILISRYSASGAELFASIMKDYHAAVIIGERSFGKGTAQTIAPLSALPAEISSDIILSLTTLYTYSPSGRPIQLQGVEPDIGVYDHQYRDCLDQCDDSTAHCRHLRHSTCCESAFFEAMHEENYENAISAPEPFQTPFKEPVPSASWLDLKERLEKYYANLNGHFTFRSLIDFFEK